MEEELNENELEGHFYSMLHYVDDTRANVTTDQNAENILEKAPQSIVRRYWRTSGERPAAVAVNTPFQKVNIPAEAPKPTNQPPNTDVKHKEEKCPSPTPIELAIFQSPIPPNMKKTIEIIETDLLMELESSDDDEVIEVALPPKPTITIESSDDEITIQDTPVKTKPVQDKGGERDLSASPVPSIISSISDDFIRGDCIALNISSRRPDNQSFDFSLHGPDLVEGSPAKKKRKKKKKNTSTPNTNEFSKPKSPDLNECFATPKSKKKTKSYVVTEKSIPSIDLYDFDSNQSVIEVSRKDCSYAVTEKSLPSADVYETDSNQSEIPKIIEKSAPALNNSLVKSAPAQNNSLVKSAPAQNNNLVSLSLDKTEENSTTPKDSTQITESIDLTENSTFYDDDDIIQESFVISNVIGLTEPECDEPIQAPYIQEQQKFGSTKVPAILYENLDFDNLKGKEKVCKNRRYSLTSLRAEMEKFYNESWGGEDFNHREIQKNMSRDKSLWAIDPKDRISSFNRKKYNVICNYCNRVGHRDDTCRVKPLVCYMCGNTGHVEPRCPSKICVNCGAPNYMYSTMCRNCASWRHTLCAECGQPGHPASHCPDLWRRYHNTIEFTPQLEQNRFRKNRHQLFCSGCTRRGHLINNCRFTLPFSGLPINSPFVYVYRPVYMPTPDTSFFNQRNDQQDSTISSATASHLTPKNDRTKRHPNSPTVHETHVAKKRHVSGSEHEPRISKSPVPSQGPQQLTPSDQPVENAEVIAQNNVNPASGGPEKAPDFIPISSNNHDKKGHVIQNNEVSDTSNVVTSCSVYITSEVMEKLKSKDGEEWLEQTTKKLDVTVEKAETNSAPVLSVKGKVGDQESFQTALREWASGTPHTEEPTLANESNVDPQTENSFVYNIPKNRNKVLRQIKKALESLKQYFGEPEELFKKLEYLRNQYGKLLKQKVISQKQLEHNINDVLRKLNIVLLGQAGLADGKYHLKRLYALQNKLVNCRQKNIPAELRQEIGSHYHRIFTTAYRNDYMELINLYNNKGFKTPGYQKFNSKFRNSGPISNQQFIDDKTGKIGKKPPMKKNDQFMFTDKTPDVSYMTADRINFEKRKIIFYQKRLLMTHPRDMVLKKTRSQLVKTSKILIGSLTESLGDTQNAPKASKGKLKKLKKFRAHAELFLNNV